MTDYNRHSIRLKDFDYSQSGLYFVTICVQNRQHLFGEIHNGTVVLNDIGRMIKECWGQLSQRFTTISLNEFVVMPNHFHAIVEISNSNNVQLSEIVGAFKSITTNEYIRGVNECGWPPFEKRVWQRNYYEHIIRDSIDYCRIADYIQNNPNRWNEDCLM